RYRERIGREIAELEREAEDLSGLTAALGPLEASARRLAEELSAARKKPAGKLAGQVESGLAELGMERAKFAVQLSPAEMAASGADAVEFVATTHPGLPPAP